MPLNDDARYRQLYLYNRAEIEQSKSMFSVLFWKAVEEKGGCEVFASAPHTAQARQAMKAYIDAMNEQQFQEECVLLTDEKLLSSFEKQESSKRPCGQNFLEDANRCFCSISFIPFDSRLSSNISHPPTPFEQKHPHIWTFGGCF